MIKKTARKILSHVLPLATIIVVSTYCHSGLGKMVPEVTSQSALFNNLPRVALLVKEQYVDPSRINSDAMLASILEVLELNISKLVITLPKPLAAALEKSKKGEEVIGESALNQAPNAAVPAVSALAPSAQQNKKTNQKEAPSTALKAKKEQIVLDLGGVKKNFEYEPQRSIWGMIFMLRDIFKFVETEAKKQKLAEKFKGGEEPIEWEKIEYAAINAMLGTLDPHSAFLEPKYARDLTLTTKGEFGGVGIVISVRDGFLTVISPIDGTPAAIAGVKAKDRIVKIDEDSAINMPLEDAVSKLRGLPNSSVNISVQRANDPKELDFTLKRSIIKVDSVAYALMDNDVGYLRIKAFQGNTAADVQAGILDMKQKSKNKMPGVILDLRDNPGGLLREAVSISDLFLSAGEVVSTQGAQKESRQVEMATPGELDENLKIVVLVNGGSASASEIVGAAIKYGGGNENDPDEGRGILIGDSATFGKGSVQMLFDFPNLSNPTSKQGIPVQPAALKLTIAQYYAPRGRIIQTVGVKPDISLTPVRTDKPNELSLFQSTSRREIDLEAHLAADKNREEKSLFHLDFLAPPLDEETNEYGKLNVDKLKSEFAINVASEFILSAQGNSRKALLANAEKIKAKLDQQEQKKIIEALKKHQIDWSSGKALTDKSGLKVSLVSNDAARGGEKLHITVKVKNTSKEPMYQLHGITHSKTDIFDQREFLFGKLEPGQEIARSLEFEIPKDVVGRKDLMKVEIRDVAHEKLSELNIPITLKGLGRPRFAHMVFVDDAKSGNGDGQPQNGEEVELVVWLKNIGDGKAFEPTVLLRNDSGSKVFLKTGREKGGELLPGQETSMRFSFRVKEPTDKADFEIQIYDGQMHDIWRDKLSIPVGMPKKGNTIDKTKIISVPSAKLFAKASADAQVLATLKQGLSGTALREYPDFYLIKISDNVVGFVKKTEVKDGVAKTPDESVKTASLYELNYDRTPAQVSLKFGDGHGWTSTGMGDLVAELNDAARVSEILLYVNGKKVLYKAIPKANAKQKLSQRLSLKPGVNIISLVAREDSHYGQRESITVYFDDQKLSLAKPEPAPKVNAQE